MSGKSIQSSFTPVTRPVIRPVHEATADSVCVSRHPASGSAPERATPAVCTTSATRDQTLLSVRLPASAARVLLATAQRHGYTLSQYLDHAVSAKLAADIPVS
jgi:hypothetical protein